MPSRVQIPCGYLSIKPQVHSGLLLLWNSKQSLGNDPSAGSPTETLLRLLLPLNDQVW